VVDFTIDEVPVAETIDADFAAAVAVSNAVEAAGYGTDEMSESAEEVLGLYHDRFEPRRMFVARVDGTIVAFAELRTRPAADAPMAWFSLRVLPQHRRRGIGSALTARLEAEALALGCSELVVFAQSPDAAGERLPSPTGFGSVPLGNPEVRFLLGHGYLLEQVERGSRLALPVDRGRLAGLLDAASATAGPDYRLHRWFGDTPQEWLEDMSVLLTRMSTDAPSAGLEEPEDPWTAERVMELDEREKNVGRTRVVCVVEHVPSGGLAGFTEMTVPAELHRPADQWSTIVLREHRGRRLGMLLKAANLLQLDEVTPGHPSIITFNAEENRYMLDVNEAVGFEPIGYEGAWKKTVG
jgi:GNAT superfamily N-acetyltransferase